MKTCPDAYHCPVEATIDIVGGKHKVLILWHLSKAGVLRFGELQRRMSQATPKMLTQQLRELEADGMVHRELYHQVPPKTEYSLTQRGVSFVPVLNAMCAWGKDVLDEVGKPSPETSEVLAGGPLRHRAVCWATLYPPQREGTHEALQSSGSAHDRR